MQRMVTDVFNERDADRRIEAIAAVFADNVVFVDPEGTVTGLVAVAEKVRVLLEGAPGFVFRLAGPIQEVADLGLDRWQFGPPGADPVVLGTDVAIIADGRIVRLYTMIDHS
jgi:hypothetical protein